MTVRDILLVHMHFSPSVTINACHNEIYLLYVYHNLLVHISFSSHVLCISLGSLQSVNIYYPATQSFLGEGNPIFPIGDLSVLVLLSQLSPGRCLMLSLGEMTVACTLKTEVIMFSKATRNVKYLPNRLIIGNLLDPRRNTWE